MASYSTEAQWLGTTGVPGPGKRRPPGWTVRGSVVINNTGATTTPPKLVPTPILSARPGRDVAIISNTGTSNMRVGPSREAVLSGSTAQGGFNVAPGGVYSHESEEALWALCPIGFTIIDVSEYYWPLLFIANSSTGGTATAPPVFVGPTPTGGTT